MAVMRRVMPVFYCSLLYFTEHYCIVYCTLQYTTVQYSTVIPPSIVGYCSVQYSALQYCTVQQCDGGNVADGASVVPGPRQSLVSYSWAMARPKGGYTPLSTVLATLLSCTVHLRCL